MYLTNKDSTFCMTKSTRAQTSVELLVILAVSLVFLLSFFLLGNQTIVDLNKEKEFRTAQYSLELLKNAANDVYYQGIGAQKKVLYSIPNDVNQSASGIMGNFFVLEIYGTTVFAKPEAPLNGSLPVSPGGHTVWLIAQEDGILVSENPPE